jgi:hypothetical protein
VVGKDIAVKKYVVRLSAEERAQLDELICKGKRSAQLVRKARILLKADVSELGEGWSDSRIGSVWNMHSLTLLKSDKVKLRSSHFEDR